VIAAARALGLVRSRFCCRRRFVAAACRP